MLWWMVTNQETIALLTLFTLVSRKQRSGSELEYTEKLQQYSKFLRPARGGPRRGHLVKPVQLTS